MRGTKKREIGSGSRGGKRENGGPRAEKEYRTGNRIVPFTSLISFGPPFFVPLFGNYPYPGPGGRSSPPSVSRFEVCPQYHPQLRISSILPRILQKICPLFFCLVVESLRCDATQVCADGKAAYQSIPASIGDLSTQFWACQRHAN